MEKLKIGHVLPASLPVTHQMGGAVERMVLSIAEQQANLGHDVVVYSANEPATHTRASGLRIERIRVSSKAPLVHYEYLFKVRRALPSFDPSVIHAHSSPFARIILGKRRAILLTLNFFRFRGSESWIGRSLYKAILEAYDSLSSSTRFSSTATAQFFRLAEVPEVLHCGVNYETFTPSAVIKNPRIQEQMNKEWIALYVGRIHRQKGSDLLGPLATSLADDGVTVVACGPFGQFDGTGHDEAKAMLGPDVRYLGVVHEDELPGIMAAAKVLILPTRHDEMFGMVLIEAGSCGTPAVASSIDAIPEVIGDAGILVQPDSVESLREAVLRLYSDPNLLAYLSARARRNAERFGWTRIAEQTIAMYKLILITRQAKAA